VLRWPAVQGALKALERKMQEAAEDASAKASQLSGLEQARRCLPSKDCCILTPSSPPCGHVVHAAHTSCPRCILFCRPLRLLKRQALVQCCRQHNEPCCCCCCCCARAYSCRDTSQHAASLTMPSVGIVPSSLLLPGELAGGHPCVAALQHAGTSPSCALLAHRTASAPRRRWRGICSRVPLTWHPSWGTADMAPVLGRC
jgi:hypothetical protein